MASDFVRNIKGVKNIDILSRNITTENDLISTTDGDVYVVTKTGYKKITNVEVQDFENLKNTVSEIDKQSDTNTSDISDLKNTTDTNTSDIETLKTTTETNTSDIADLKTTTDTNTSDIADLKTTTDTNTSDIADLKTDVSTNTSDIGTLKTDVSTNTSDIADLNTTTDTNTSDISELKTTTDTNTSDISELKTTTDTNTSDISELKTTTDTNTSDITELKNYKVLLFEGSASNTGDVITLNQPYNDFTELKIKIARTGGHEILNFDAEDDAGLSINITNIYNDNSEMKLYEMIIAKNSPTELEIASQRSNTIINDNPTDDSAITILKVWGVK